MGLSISKWFGTQGHPRLGSGKMTAVSRFSKLAVEFGRAMMVRPTPFVSGG